jgi:hypothetical protein
LINRLSLAVLALLMLVLSPRTAHAEPFVVFNNFGRGDTFDFGSPNGVWIPVVPAPFFVGFSFTPQRDSLLHDVTVAMSARKLSPFVPADVVTLAIRSRSADGLADAILGTLRVAGLPRFGDPFSPLTAAFDGRLLLRGGKPYWLTATAESGLAVWNFNSTGHAGDVIVTDDNDQCCFLEFGTTGAFRVTADRAVAATPEPATLLFVASGFGFSVFAHRRRSRSSSEHG